MYRQALFNILPDLLQPLRSLHSERQIAESKPNMPNRLCYALAFLAILALGCGKQRLQTGVVVIGAGISGIAAAEHLKSRGVDVLVLEARDRVGGRIHSLTSETGHVFEIGAGWIEGTEENPLVGLAEKLNLPTQSDDGENTIWFDAAGRKMPADATEKIGSHFEGWVSHLETLRATQRTDVPLETALESYAAAAEMDNEAKTGLHFSLATEIEADYAGDRSELSLQHFDSDRGRGDESLIVPDGYDQIVKRLASKLDIRLKERVRVIDSRRDGISVETENLKVEAQQAIVTVPLGVLQAGTIRFRPELPERKRRAMQALKMGTLHRTYFIFKEAFWSEGVHTFYHVGAWPAFINMQFYNGQPALLAFHGGKAGRRLDAMGDAEIGREGMAILRKLFGEKIPEPAQVIASHWEQDSLSRGTYSFIPVGATPSDYDAMAEPVGGKLYFAGEATNRKDPATVHGAYLSGKREGRRILREHYRDRK